MDPISFADFQKNASSDLVKFTKNARILCSGDLAFNRSLDNGFANALGKANEQVLGLINVLLRNASHGTEIDFERLEDADSIETRWSVVSEVVDMLLEKADMCLDEYTGTVKRGVMQTSSAGNNYKSSKFDSRTPEMKKSFRKSLHMPKPQLQFRNPLDPLDASPYRPRLTRKPHALIQLEESLIPEVVDGRQKYPHPYLEEINRYSFPERVYKVSDPIPYKPFDSTTAIWVDTPELLDDMVNELLQAEEIAVDLEHHDYRTFIGLVCLMQISTRDQDWIIDTLKLRDELEVLNKVFANPEIVKVFHGAHMDMIWLQRDLGLYVVGLFDTYEASKVLGFTGHSLAFLLKKYINFDADKSYQLADWRIRPIPQEMLAYARSDTHFLLYIYDNVRNELVKRSTDEENRTKIVLDNSKETSLKIYDTEPYDSVNGSGSRGWLSILKHNPINFTDQQFSVFKALHAWRDRVAREEDENINYILSRNHLLSFARRMPTDNASILSMVHNSGIIKARIRELVALIKEAKENPVQFSSINHLLAGKYWTPEGKPTTKAGETDQNSTHQEDIPFNTEDGNSKTEKSQFWKETFGSSRWEVKDILTGIDEISLALPLPHLNATLFADSAINEPQAAADRPEHVYVKNRPSSNNDPEILVINQPGGGRKRKHVDAILREQEHKHDMDENLSTVEHAEDTTDHDAFESPSIDSNPEMVKSKAASKAEKRAKRAERKRKREQKGARGSEQGAPNDDTFQPFDYSAAPSVLNAQREDGGGRGFDPRKKYDTGPKGVRGRRPEKEGMSATFKN